MKSASLAAQPTSKVPVVMKRYTNTFFCCPMRKARSVAWASTAGFHLRGSVRFHFVQNPGSLTCKITGS